MRLFRIYGLGGNCSQATDSKLIIAIHVLAKDLANEFRARRPIRWGIRHLQGGDSGLSKSTIRVRVARAAPRHRHPEPHRSHIARQGSRWTEESTGWRN